MADTLPPQPRPFRIAPHFWGEVRAAGLLAQATFIVTPDGNDLIFAAETPPGIQIAIRALLDAHDPHDTAKADAYRNEQLSLIAAHQVPR